MVEQLFIMQSHEEMTAIEFYIKLGSIAGTLILILVGTIGFFLRGHYQEDREWKKDITEVIHDLKILITKHDYKLDHHEEDIQELKKRRTR